jgi:hypothetical protein
MSEGSKIKATPRPFTSEKPKGRDVTGKYAKAQGQARTVPPGRGNAAGAAQPGASPAIPAK